MTLLDETDSNPIPTSDRKARPVSRSHPRATAALLALVVLATATACGGDDEPANPAAPPASAPEPGSVLLGTVGTPEEPDAFEIALTDEDGEPVTTIPAGDYTIRVSDLSAIHNFAISGEGVDEATSVPERGEQEFEVTFVAGTYTYVCDPHPSMTGQVDVV